jgi:signal recognition particle subunit SRP54
MFFETLSEKLQQSMRHLSGTSHLTEENMDTALGEVRRALLEADVSLRSIKTFLSRVREQAVGQNVLKGIDPEQQLIKIIHDELVILMGKEQSPLNLSETPSIILMFGLQGSGKTTTCGKLALKLLNEGKRPFLIAADVYRPAAVTQLSLLGEQVQVPVFSLADSTDVLNIVQAGIAQAKAADHDVIIVDTAGRLQVDTEMMSELLLLERMVQPQEKLLVVDAMTGQEAVYVAEAFDTQLGMTGLVLTKMDGDARGGAALSVVEATGKPIKLMGVSEKPEGLETFYPDRLASRILGMGDVVSLVERAQHAIKKEEAEALNQKLRQKTFSFNDYLKMQNSFKMLGSLEGILGMLPIPGIDKGMRQMLSQTSEGRMQGAKVMIQSMTRQEREIPDCLTPARMKRIAAGCGKPEKEVTDFVREFLQMRTMMGEMMRIMDAFKTGNFAELFNSDLFKGMADTPTSRPGFRQSSSKKNHPKKKKKR